MAATADFRFDSTFCVRVRDGGGLFFDGYFALSGLGKCVKGVKGSKGEGREENT